MIKAVYKTDGLTHSLSINGHADYSQRGDDIVCSAVSGIIYALVGWMENNSEDISICDKNIDSGDVKIYCEGGERTATAFQMTAIGIEQIANEYPSHVVIDTTEF